MGTQCTSEGWLRPLRSEPSEAADAIAATWTACCRDYGFAWEWEISRDGERIHNGAALSESAALRAIRVVANAFALTLDEVRVEVKG